MTDNAPIAVIKKNVLDEIRVMRREYKGHEFIDIRVYTELDGKPDKVPTKRGVTVAPHILGELIAALEKAAEGIAVAPAEQDDSWT
ncbi:MAG: transcriptional coactivator p15/PC4 family protein [Gammaproteobacteria bacterium]